MATVKIQLDKSRQKKNETYPIVLRVNHKGQFRVSLNTSVREDQFENGQIINHSQRAQLNNFLNRSVQDALNLIFDLRLVNRLNSLSNVDLKALIENKPIEKKEVTFKEACDKYSTRSSSAEQLVCVCITKSPLSVIVLRTLDLMLLIHAFCCSVRFSNSSLVTQVLRKEAIDEKAIFLYSLRISSLVIIDLAFNSLCNFSMHAVMLPFSINSKAFLVIVLAFILAV